MIIFISVQIQNTSIFSSNQIKPAKQLYVIFSTGFVSCSHPFPTKDLTVFVRFVFFVATVFRHVTKRPIVFLLLTRAS